MSAGVSDQRMKGQGNQVTNGPKDHVNEHEDYDSWRSQHHQGYSTPISTSMASDPYTMPNYYGTSFQYQTFGVGDGTWSNGGDPMTFLGGYTGQMGHDSYGMEGMFGGGGGGFGNAFAQPTAPAAGFNYFHGNGDYSTWGSSAAMSRKPHYEDYYRGSDGGMYSAVDTLKGVEQGMQALGLGDPNVKVMDGKPDMKGEMTNVQSQSAPKKMTWASIASQPAKPTPQLGSGGMKKKGPGMPPPPMVPGKHNMDIGTWEGKNGGATIGVKPVGPPPQVRPAWGGPIRGAGPRPAGPNGFPGGPAPPHHHPHQVAILAPPHHHHPQQGPMMAGPPPHQMAQVPPPPIAVIPQQQQQQPGPPPSHPVLDELRGKNNYNPVDFDLSAKNARFFVIKSYSEDDIHRSIKYEIWCSTEHGNKRLDQAFRERDGKGVVYLFFSVNGSGHFCGMAKMTSPVDYQASSSVWSQDKWKGQFRVSWIYVKDVPNVQLRHIRLENNENKPVTNSRDTQEVPHEKGRQVLKVMHVFRHSTSIFDDFVHYEKRQEEEDSRKEPPPPVQTTPPQQQQQQHSPVQGERPQQQPQQHKEREGGSGGGGRGGRGGRGGSRNN